MSPEDVPVGDEVEMKEESAKKAKSSSSSSSSSSSAAVTSEDAKKRKRESTDAESSHPKAKKSPSKANDGDDEEGARVGADEPKKFRRAFGWFVKEKRAEAEKSLADNRADVDELKDLLSQMWEELAPEDRLQYQNKEADDKAR